MPIETRFDIYRSRRLSSTLVERDSNAVTGSKYAVSKTNALLDKSESKNTPTRTRRHSATSALSLRTYSDSHATLPLRFTIAHQTTQTRRHCTLLLLPDHCCHHPHTRVSAPSVARGTKRVPMRLVEFLSALARSALLGPLTLWKSSSSAVAGPPMRASQNAHNRKEAAPSKQAVDPLAFSACAPGASDEAHLSPSLTTS